MKKCIFAVMLTLIILLLILSLPDFTLKPGMTVPPPSPLTHKEDTVTVSVIGDVMMHTRQLEYDHRCFLKNISHGLCSADFSAANMEFSLAGEPWSGYPAFSAPDSYAGYVKSCGVDIFLMANNHILDKGRKGFSRTFGVYDSLGGIRTCGAGTDEARMERDNPLILLKKGIRIALVNFTYGSNNPDKGDSWPKLMQMDRNQIHAAFVRAKEKGADFIIALPHWGEEYELRHSEKQRQWAEWLVGEGADIIIGSHPHVIQDTTHIKGVPVIYSVGNAVSNMSKTNTRLELEVRVSFTGSVMGEKKKMLEPELRFMWCSLPGMLTDNYSTIYVDEWEGRRDEWAAPCDYDNMTSTLKRVKAETGIE